MYCAYFFVFSHLSKFLVSIFILSTNDFVLKINRNYFFLIVFRLSIISLGGGGLKVSSHPAGPVRISTNLQKNLQKNDPYPWQDSCMRLSRFLFMSWLTWFSLYFKCVMIAIEIKCPRPLLNKKSYMYFKKDGVFCIVYRVNVFVKKCTVIWYFRTLNWNLLKISYFWRLCLG